MTAAEQQKAALELVKSIAEGKWWIVDKQLVEQAQQIVGKE